jgi:hypothetical protein
VEGEAPASALRLIMGSNMKLNFKVKLCSFTSNQAKLMVAAG